MFRLSLAKLAVSGRSTGSGKEENLQGAPSQHAAYRLTLPAFPDQHKARRGPL